MFAGFSELSPAQLTLYTDALIITGSVRTRQRRVTDMLNHAEEPFFVLEDVTTVEFGPGGTRSHAEYAQVNLEAVLFAVAHDPVTTSPELRMAKLPERALVSVPPFKVLGTIHLIPAEGNLRTSLSALTGRFLPVTDAIYWSDRVGEERRDALLVAVNHRRAQILAPYRESGAADNEGADPTAADPEVEAAEGA